MAQKKKPVLQMRLHVLSCAWDSEARVRTRRGSPVQHTTAQSSTMDVGYLRRHARTNLQQVSAAKENSDFSC
jgi:hypothetical protein